MTNALACVVAFAATTHATDPNSGHHQNEAMNCTVAYTSAYMATLSGACSGPVCTTPCQAKLTAVDKACSHQTFNHTDDNTGNTIEKSFTNKAQRALRLMGPQDCQYGGIAKVDGHGVAYQSSCNS